MVKMNKNFIKYSDLKETKNKKQFIPIISIPKLSGRINISVNGFNKKYKKLK